MQHREVLAEKAQKIKTIPSESNYNPPKAYKATTKGKFVEHVAT